MNPIHRKPPRGSTDFAATQIEANPSELPFDDPSGLADDSAPMPLELMLSPNQSEPTIGHVGRYALKRRLGEGGLGRVYTAWDPILSRNLAIKTLQIGAIHSHGVQRSTLDAMILDEARAAASLSHPNIVTIYDAGLSDMGVYIAMEQLPGADLRQLLDEGWRPDPLRAAKLMRRVADALAVAHENGVIHCDIKPANIFMIDRRQPKVLDFGIARVAHRTGAATLGGLITGSPHYVAPEQLRGRDPDARTDVYAMGVVLYELLTGRRAFPGRSVKEIASAVLQGEPVPAHELVSGLSPELSAIAMRAMARLPEKRFASAREMSTALRQWQAKAASGTAAAHASAHAPASPSTDRPGSPTASASARKSAHKLASRGADAADTDAAAAPAPKDRQWPRLAWLTATALTIALLVGLAWLRWRVR